MASVPASGAPGPTDAEVVPGLADNVLLRDALAELPPEASPAQLLNVARQLLQGHVYLRVRGPVHDLLAQGAGMPLAVATIDGERYLMAYSGGAALQAAARRDGDQDSSAIAQPVLDVLRQVAEGGLGGIVLDHASGSASAMLPQALVATAVADLDPTLTLKEALNAERTPQLTAEVVRGLIAAPLWIAARRGEDGRVGVAEMRTEEGLRVLEVFSHPLELHAFGRGDQPVRIGAAQLAAALREDAGLDAVVLNPRGPWLMLDRTDLAPIIALAG